MGLNPSRGRKFSFFPHPPRPAPVPTQPPIQWAPGGFFPGVKRPGHKIYDLTPLSAKVKNEWIYTPTICLLGVGRDNLPLPGTYIYHFYIKD
jgi:hypothetical protein